jgi:hypothetical protein
MINFYIGKPNNQINAESLDAAFIGLPIIFEMIQSPDLFGEKKTYRITGVESSDELRQEFFKTFPEVDRIVHDVIVVFDKILALEKKKLDPRITITETKPVKAPAETFNPFSLGNAFASGDKKKAWMVFQELISHDDEMEKTHGLVWWKLKDMVQKGSGFSKSQLESMARNLVGVYHESRLGGLGMKERLELFFLTLPEIK